MSKEAMNLALEALENSIDLVSQEAREAEKMYANVPTRLARVQGLVAYEVAHEKAITALREALAEQTAQQEPTGMLHIDRLDKWLDASLKERKAQRTWVGLTDEEIQTEWVLTPQNDKAEGIWFGRRIEAKLKEKNT